METSPTSASTSDKRIDLLDGWRSLAVICMVIWHLLYDLRQQSIGSIVPSYYPWRLIRCAAVHSFLFLAGVSSHLSKNNLRRAGKLCLCALCVNAVMLFIDPVVFGILHLMGLCTLLWAWWKPKGSVWLGLGCLALFAALYPWLPDVRIGFDALCWLGLRSEAFYSADYYPLLPWGLLFFAGGFLGEGICKRLRGIPLPSWCTWIGRHALLLYAVHQPILLGCIWLWQRLG